MSMFNINSASFHQVYVSGTIDLTGSINLTGSLLLDGKNIENVLGDTTEYGSLLLNYDNDTSTNPITIPPRENFKKSYFKMNGNWVNTPVTQIALSMWNYKKQYPYYYTLKDILERNLIGTKITLNQLKTSISKVYKITNITKSGSFIEDDINYANESSNWIPGFFILDVEDLSYNLNEYALQSYLDDEYSIDFEFANIEKLYEKITFEPSNQEFKYDIPSWARKITVVAIGGGGGGGGGVGIYRDADYPMGDSVDLLHYNIDKSKEKDFPNSLYVDKFNHRVDMPPNQTNLQFSQETYIGITDGKNRYFVTNGNTEKVIPDRVLNYYNQMTGSIKYMALVGGGGGAGGNVVWKTYTTNDFLPGSDKFIIYSGKGGKGGKGGDGKILQRTSSDLGLDSSGSASFLKKNSIVKEVITSLKRHTQVNEIGFKYYSYPYARKHRPTSRWMHTRSGQLNWVKNNNNEKTPDILANSGGDSVVFLVTNYLYKKTKVVAEGGYGGFPGYGIHQPSDWLGTGNDRSWQYPLLSKSGMFGGNLFGWPIFDDNGQINPYPISNFQSHPGASHKQLINNNYDGILIGGPGGHGIAMSVQGGERFFNYAPDLPWNLSNSTYTNTTNNLVKPWGSNGDREFYSGMRYVGFDDPSEYAPTGGGGGNGAILPIVKEREQFILNNPGLDTDSIETFNYMDSPWGGKGAFYYTQDTTIGLGGKNKIQSIIFDDIYLGEGGNGGNSFLYPPNSLTVTLPTTGSSYGGGGGGGASLYYDLESDATAIGQDGADGGDGIVVIIVEN